MAKTIQQFDHIVTLHREEVTHIEFERRMIVPVGEAFFFADRMPTWPVRFLVAGWEAKAKTVTPEHGPAWLDTSRCGYWVSSRLVDEMGRYVSFGAGNYSPFVVLTREKRERVAA